MLVLVTYTVKPVELILFTEHPKTCVPIDVVWQHATTMGVLENFVENVTSADVGVFAADGVMDKLPA